MIVLFVVLAAVNFAMSAWYYSATGAIDWLGAALGVVFLCMAGLVGYAQSLEKK